MIKCIKNNKAFTLVELLIVIIISAFFFSIILAGSVSVAKSYNRTKHVQECNQEIEYVCNAISNVINHNKKSTSGKSFLLGCYNSNDDTFSLNQPYNMMKYNDGIDDNNGSDACLFKNDKKTLTTWMNDRYYESKFEYIYLVTFNQFNVDDETVMIEIKIMDSINGTTYKLLNLK